MWNKNYDNESIEKFNVEKKPLIYSQMTLKNAQPQIGCLTPNRNQKRDSGRFRGKIFFEYPHRYLQLQGGRANDPIRTETEDANRSVTG
jgi:hypothetical protein